MRKPKEVDTKASKYHDDAYDMVGKAQNHTYKTIGNLQNVCANAYDLTANNYIRRKL